MKTSAQLASQLSALGLSASESAVYCAVLSSSGGTASEIARISGIERTNCYYTLAALAKRGLVSSSDRGGSRFFSAEAPERLVEHHRSLLAGAERVLPFLKELEGSAHGGRPRMRHYDGRAAQEKLLLDAADCRGELLLYTNVALQLEKLPDASRELAASLEARSVRARIISSYDAEAILSFRSLFKRGFKGQGKIQMLYVNPREFGLQSAMIIDSASVSLISLEPGDDSSVVIENRGFSASSKAIFELAWLGATAFIAT